mmetsp:Transcript_27577/g.60491  ORF Transcript_27577/g.60491 Transcript_27577/m.60491 type:complete len:595 (+) Transcript_27577:103-1887(+)
MLNLQQLLQLVVSRPDRSNVDLRFLTHIWEACLKWCQQQFNEKIGVRFLGLGEFCFRRDFIGEMEFWNPMFIMAESFARSHNLHDRRPKTHAAEAESTDLDVAQIAQIATEMLGEVIGREVVDNALRDVVDRIGEVCADEKQGIVILDFNFGKLIAENKSVEFSFGDGRPPKTGKSSAGRSQASATAARPFTSASYSSLSGSDVALGLTGASVPGMSKKTPAAASPAASPVVRAPLQRPYVKHYKTTEKVTEMDLMRSHHQQLEQKEAQLHAEREQEAKHNIDTLQRLRGEMLMDFELREARRSIDMSLAEQLQQQKLEKRERDLKNSQPVGINYWPFRSEEEVQATQHQVNQQQKAALDRQLQEKLEKRAFLESVMQKQSMAEDSAAARQAELAKEEAKLRQRAMAAQAKSIDRNMDDAFKRYENYLENRKAAIDHSKSFQREQRYLSEQSELLKQEETRRRMEHMRNYLAAQVGDKKSKDEAARLEALHERPYSNPTTLPRGSEPEEGEEQYVKMALKHALDQQVEERRQIATAIKQEHLQEERKALDCISREMQQARFREIAARKDQKEMLDHTWQKQAQLKKMELSLDRE